MRPGAILVSLIQCLIFAQANRKITVDAITPSRIEQAILAGEPLDSEMLALLRKHQRRHRAAFNWMNELQRRPKMPDLRSARASKYASASRGLSSLVVDEGLGQTCSIGSSPAALGGPILKWGSHPEPELGPAIDPPPHGWNGPTLHAYSLLTPGETSEISIAAAAAASNFDALTINDVQGFSGYDTTHPSQGDGRVLGWDLNPSLTQCLFVPDLPSIGESTLEIHARLSNDHQLEDLLAMWVAPDPQTGTNVHIESAFYVTIYQGLESFWGPPQAPSDFAKTFEYYVYFDGRKEWNNWMPDGYLDFQSKFKYDGQSILLFFEFTLHMLVEVNPGGAPCFCAIDARVVDDDRTLVVPDGVDEESLRSYPQLMEKSCPYRLSDTLLCRPS
jgi:hypothetical protein